MWGTRRRAGALLAGFTTMVVTLLAMPAGAGAAELPVGGTFTGSATFDFPSGDPGCEIHHTIDGTGDWVALGATSVRLDYCVVIQGPDPQPVVGGWFTISSASGQLSGTLAGEASGLSLPPDPRGWPYRFDLTVTGGTGQFAGATGALHVDGYLGVAGIVVEGTVGGSVTVGPPIPGSPDDCRQGGWQLHGDESGAPFRNQGDCIAWVRQHSRP